MTLLDTDRRLVNNGDGMEPKIHEFQISILRELLFVPEARFRDLNKTGVTNDHFTFHLKRLLKNGLVQKIKDKYSLTDKGKEFANRMDTKALKLERQAKLAIAVEAIRENRGKVEYLVHRRLKQPFYGWYGSISGKIRWGEAPLETARREFKEETGLTGDFHLKAIVNYHHFHKDGRLLEDKYFWVYLVDNTKGKLKERVKEGENIWLTESQYRKLKNVFADFDETADVLNARGLKYIERRKFVKEY